MVPGNRNNAILQNLLPDTPYNITVEAIYAEGPGASLNGNGRTGTVIQDWLGTGEPSMYTAPNGLPEKSFQACRAVE